MATALTKSRQSNKRRLAAVNFLSNISLDGTHKDTKLHVLSAETRPRFASFGNSNKPVRNLSHQNSKYGSSESIARNFIVGRKRTASLCANITASSPHQPIFFKSPKDCLKDGRIIFVTANKAPLVVFSALPYCKRDYRQELGKRRHTSGSRQLISIADGPDLLELSIKGFEKPVDGQEISYSDLLAPSAQRFCQCRKHKWKSQYSPQEAAEHHTSGVRSYDKPAKSFHSHYLHHQVLVSPALIDLDTKENFLNDKYQYHPHCHHPHHLVYHPNLLDDPELIAGKHSTLLAFPSYLTSIIDYVKPSDLKKELNEKFKERFPSIKLTLSKMRSLKKEMFKITKNENGADFLTIAQAYVFFEKLILKLLVDKQNRKTCAGACIILSAKLNDVKGNELKLLMEKIESGFRVNRRELLAAEFGVLVALEFSLHLPVFEILPHFQRLIYET